MCELTRRSEAEILSQAECAEYIVLAEQLETADAARLEAALTLYGMVRTIGG